MKQSAIRRSTLTGRGQPCAGKGNTTKNWYKSQSLHNLQTIKFTSDACDDLTLFSCHCPHIAMVLLCVRPLCHSLQRCNHDTVLSRPYCCSSIHNCPCLLLRLIPLLVRSPLAAAPRFTTVHALLLRLISPTSAGAPLACGSCCQSCRPPRSLPCTPIQSIPGGPCACGCNEKQAHAVEMQAHAVEMLLVCVNMCVNMCVSVPCARLRMELFSVITCGSDCACMPVHT